MTGAAGLHDGRPAPRRRLVPPEPRQYARQPRFRPSRDRILLGARARFPVRPPLARILRASMARRSASGNRLGVMRALNLLAFLPIAGKAPLYGRLLLALVADSRVPPARKALLGLAAAYVVSPFDIIPERIPLLGAIDDIAVVVLAVDAFLEGLPKDLVNEKLEELGI